MKVLMLHLPFTRHSYLGYFSVPEPLAALFIAPALAGHEVRFVDLRVTPNLQRELDGFVPDVAAVGVGPLTVGAAGRTLSELRARFPRIRIVLHSEAEYGNSHFVERPRDFVHPLADALARPIFLAPLRRVLADLVEAWDSGSPASEVAGLLVRGDEDEWTSTPPVLDRVADVGAPDRTLLGRARGRYRFSGIGRMAHLFYSYGCKFKCRFCPMSKHDGSLSTRSLDAVVRELAEMTEPHVYLQDYEPFLLPEAMHALADAVEREGIRKRWYMLTRADTALEQRDLIARWRKLGLRWLYLGLDGHSPERLKEIRKGASVETNERALRAMRELGLGVTVGFLVRPDFTREDFAALREYTARLRAPIFGFTVETPLIGTRWFDDNETHVATSDPSLFDLQHALLPTALPREDFYGELLRMHLFGGIRSLPGMLRHFPLRDFARNSIVGWRALDAVRRSARDHADVITREATRGSRIAAAVP